VTAGALTGVVRSEWVKLRSLRSTVAGYAAIGVVLVALYGIFLTLPAGTSGDPAFTALLVAELLVAGVAVLATAGEYSAGTARSTFTARVLTAKLVAHACVLLVLTALAAAVGWTSAAVAVPEAAGSPLDPVVLRAGLGTALALGCVVVLGMSAGLLTRSPAAGLTAAFLVLVVPVVVVTAPEVTAYLPGRAVVALVLAPRPAEAHLLPTWTATLVLGAWSAGSAVVAAAALRHRDV
jgi:ABC-2 type transport system permease protein